MEGKEGKEATQAMEALEAMEAMEATEATEGRSVVERRQPLTPLRQRWDGSTSVRNCRGDVAPHTSHFASPRAHGRERYSLVFKGPGPYETCHL